ncbi:MAG: DUF177 domain-containing protein [Chloroflexota bacterium]|nr:MAG: DUF177 domain-containing protein [Chloroflexota bacterium]
MHVNKPITDLKFNVAQLLREEVGARRSYTFAEEQLALDDDTMLRDLEGAVRFTRTVSGVLADTHARGTVEMECIRCLARAPQPLEIHFNDEFHSRIEVNTGVALPEPDEEDPFYIDESHMLDLGEAIREYALLELPMQPLCRADCKGLCPICGKDRNVEACDCEESGGDDRFSILRSLLNE